MTVSRRDTIILATLFNVVVLTCVLATARQLTPKAPPKSPPQGLYQPPASGEVAEEPAPGKEPLAFDEIDLLLEEYVSEASTPQATKKPKARAAAPANGPEFYIVQARDNPWKIAKKFRLSFEKLLQLNHLDEAKAKNLKIGQRLRIREPA